MAYGVHLPVMVREVMEALVNDSRGRYLDATAGGGGHIAALLDLLSPDASVVALDRDADAVMHLESRFASDSRVSVVRGNFSEISTLPGVADVAPYAGVLMDFGLSSHQIDSAERGFSFMREGPLDMRMDRSASVSAADVVNGYPVEQLARLLREYGELKGARRIAARIVAGRPYTATNQLAKAVSPGVPDNKLLAQVFQALRIEVNGELEAIERGLESAIEMLAPGARLVTLAYHSLEDRRVKRTFRLAAGEPLGQESVPVELREPKKASVRLVFRKAVKPSEEEQKSNRRSRSARMRVVEKLA